MAGRFVFQKLSSRMSRSGEPIARLALVREGGIRTLHNLFNGASAHRSIAAPNLPATHGHGYNQHVHPCHQAEMAGRFLFQKLSSRMSRSGEPIARLALVREGGIRTLHNLFNGASAHRSIAAPNLPATHGHATRYFNTLLCARASSETGIPPVLALKPEFVNSAGVKRTFSSRTSTNDTITRTAELDAKLAACRAEVADWFAEKKKEDAAFFRYLSRLVGYWCLLYWCLFSMLDSGSSHSDTRQCEGKSGSHCQAAASANPSVKNP